MNEVLVEVLFNLEKELQKEIENCEYYYKRFTEIEKNIIRIKTTIANIKSLEIK